MPGAWKKEVLEDYYLTKEEIEDILQDMFRLGRTMFKVKWSRDQQGKWTFTVPRHLTEEQLNVFFEKSESNRRQRLREMQLQQSQR